MPIIKGHGKICHFAHIPKCAGSSVEHHFRQIGLDVGFLDTSFVWRPSPVGWNHSSPQHIDGYSLSRLFPNSFFDFCFAVVRDPLARLSSAYSFGRRLRGPSRPQEATLEDFVKGSLRKAAMGKGCFDNHFLPQEKFLLDLDYSVFKIEDGMDVVKTYIDTSFFGVETAVPMTRRNKRKGGGRGAGPAQVVTLSQEAREICNEIYKCDYERFGYDPEAV